MVDQVPTKGEASDGADGELTNESLTREQDL